MHVHIRVNVPTHSYTHAHAKKHARARSLSLSLSLSCSTRLLAPSHKYTCTNKNANLTSHLPEKVYKSQNQIKINRPRTCPPSLPFYLSCTLPASLPSISSSLFLSPSPSFTLFFPFPLTFSISVFLWEQVSRNRLNPSMHYVRQAPPSSARFWLILFIWIQQCVDR